MWKAIGSRQYAVGAAAPQQPSIFFDINANLISPAVPTNATLRLCSADSAGTFLIYQQFGASSNFFRAYQFAGTAASPTAVTSGTQLFNISAFGYDGTAFASNSPAATRIQFLAQENFDSTHHGSAITFATVATGGSTSLIEAMRIQNSGGLSVGTTSDPGTD
jgi:hypothetical protein